jgi:hypothetical protein
MTAEKNPDANKEEISNMNLFLKLAASDPRNMILQVTHYQ